MAYQYKVLGQVVELEVDPSVVAVRFDDSQPKSMRALATASAGAGPFAKRFEVPGEKLTLVPVAPKAGAGPAMAAMTVGNLNAQAHVDRAQPVFRVGGNQVVASDRVIVGLDRADAKAALTQKYGLTELRAWDSATVFQLPADADVFQLLEQLDAEPGVRYAEPDFVTIGRHIPRRVAPAVGAVLSDPMVDRQYAMTLTRSVDAWAVQRGCPEIKIAILDEGVDTEHPDLKAAVVGAYDGIDDDSFQTPNGWDGHGTACAGLAAAVPLNDIGISGSGGGCSLLAVRIAHSEMPNGPWVTSNEIIARAIAWSWTNGADILSNSWGGGLPSSAIIEEFEKARRQGRNGLGCVIVIAAGNDHGRVSFPGTLPEVLTVAASNEYDEPKTPTSADGETWWGTNYGPEIDVGAPGVHNLTTDISGTSGYDPTDFAGTFNGTSSATPIVAGICGLVLSANPNLREYEVREIIRNTAAKVGSVPYVAGRNDYFGQGRVDALAAVQAAGAPSSIMLTAVETSGEAEAEAQPAPIDPGTEG
jgi:subtilisin family serine protease